MRKKIMLVSSSGGHWVQLNRLVPAFEGCELIFVTTDIKHRSSVGRNLFLLVPDASRWNKLKIIWLAIVMLKHVVSIRPDVIITTGAAPGFFALFFGKKFGAKTMWLDSIANVEELSMSGQLAKKYADLWLTQWEHLSLPNGPTYVGAVL
ncbi:MAG: UDP-N-acetylglucosamine--LPS N-acetylglucosamine transferase [Desulfobulbus sp.]|nr:UDP-N-acetylglucosamine--LPS N-acetylglucosamine transferase [Desulfobulbus sp.]